MDKEEILEKSRADSEGRDERFVLVGQQMGLIVGSVVMLGLAVLYLWDFFHGLDTNGISAVFMAGAASMCYVQFFRLRMKFMLFFAILATLAAVSWAVQHVLATM